MIRISRYHVSQGIIFLLAIFLMLTGCEEETVPVNPVVTPTARLETDTLWLLDSDNMHRVLLRLSPPASAEGREVTAQLTGGGITISFRLFDDGSLNHLPSPPPYLDNYSGDDAARDGIFCRRVSSRFTTIEGLYNLTVAISGTPLLDTLRQTIHIRLNRPPEIRSTTLPDSIPSGARDSLFMATLFDADGLDDITSVELLQYRPAGGTESYSMFRMNDSLRVYRNRPEIAKWIPTGYVPFRFRVTDRYLNITESDLDSVYLTNLAPTITGITGVDTIKLAPGDTLYFYYFVSVTDDQGFHDLDTLRLIIKSADRPDILYSYLDNGDSAKFDSTANDGKYTAWFQADPTSRRNVLFTFEWTPTDRVGQRGVTEVRTLVILDKTGDGGARKQPYRKTGYHPNAVLIR